MSQQARRRSLTIEGWRAIPHSYAIVAAWHCLSLLKQRDVDLGFADYPFHDPRWVPMRGLLDAAAERALAQLPQPTGTSDVTYRVAFPFDFTPGRSARTVVFGTTEYGVLNESVRPSISAESLAASGVRVVTPSSWSRRGFERWGVPAEAMRVVPHGVDTRIFNADKRRRDEVRKQLGLYDVVMLSLGAMTGNKGVDLLLRAFATVARKYRNVTLLLKGADPLYGSQSLLGAAIAGLSAGDRTIVQSRIRYIGGVGSATEVAQLYQAADVYVAPYRAEGFCMPVLEAMSCGLPVICTAGGPTDDFTTHGSALFIPSEEKRLSDQLRQLEPDLDALTNHLLRAAEDANWRKSAGMAGRQQAVSHYSWDAVTKRLLQELFPAD